MAKRGETLAWRTTYTWENGVHGVIASHSQDAAEFKAAELRRTAEGRGLEISVTVTRR